jgi:predicted kinase
MKTLILLRGLPGSGKSTLAKSLAGEHIEADMYFVDNETGEYK